MIKIITATYVLLLTNNPCDVFTFFNQEEISGFTKQECDAYELSSDSLSMASWNANTPETSTEYPGRFVLINLSMLSNDSIENANIIKHELMNQAYWIYNFDESKINEMSSWTESEYKNIYNEIRSRY